MAEPNDPGTVNPDEQASGDTPGEQQFVTMEQLKSTLNQFQNSLGQVVNSAVSSHMKRQKGPDVETLKADLLKEIEQKQKPKTADGESQDSAATAALKAQVEQMQSKLDASNQRAQELENKRRSERAMHDLKGFLSKDVRPEFLDVLTRDLYQGQKRVELTEDGEAMFRIQRTSVPGLPPEEHLVPLADGVQEFLKSKEAEAFLPPPTPAAQNGGRIPTNSRQKIPEFQGPPKTNAEKVQRAQAIEAQLKADGVSM